MYTLSYECGTNNMNRRLRPGPTNIRVRRFQRNFTHLVIFTISGKEVPYSVVQIKFLMKENSEPSEVWRRLENQYTEATVPMTQHKFSQKKI